ncbi:hypothetical protein Ssi02_41980 [Sinosporangium siamense]|uniref:MerR family transcriptional regulator n=2 Tax=Sinosporangium siamense TaxID=1367973 RepID=A0A919RHQ2_9ACTN|nr:hypothetical protein Ssi02_41980 [Sinosporangium siamense]
MSRLVVRRVPPGRVLDLESFAHATGLHPDLARRLVALGLLEAAPDAGGRLWFPLSQIAAAGRIQRLRAGFSLNYAALGLVMDLLDHIAELEAALRDRRRNPRTGGGSPWTRTD